MPNLDNFYAFKSTSGSGNNGSPGGYGGCFGFIIVVTKLCSLKSFGKPFMIGISTFIKTKNKSLKVISASKEEI